MQEMRFHVETQKYATVKKLLYVFAALPLAYMIFVGFLLMLGEHNSFVRKAYLIAIPVGIVTIGLIAAAVFVYFRYRESVTLTPVAQGGLQFIVRNADRNEYGATGRWSCHALYTKHYHKYGTYRKELYLILFCNDKMFCVLRHEVAPAFSPPQGFREISAPPVADVPWYHTSETEAVYGLITGNVRQPAAIPNQYGNWRDTQL